jgi:hypothetical protein
VKILREKTKWDDVQYTVKNHDYLVSDDNSKCHGMRKSGSNVWEKFTKPLTFSRYRRSFDVLNEEIPLKFVKPYTIDPNTFITLDNFMN